MTWKWWPYWLGNKECLPTYGICPYVYAWTTITQRNQNLWFCPWMYFYLVLHAFGSQKLCIGWLLEQFIKDLPSESPKVSNKALFDASFGVWYRIVNPVGPLEILFGVGYNGRIANATGLRIPQNHRVTHPKGGWILTLLCRHLMPNSQLLTFPYYSVLLCS